MARLLVMALMFPLVGCRAPDVANTPPDNRAVIARHTVEALVTACQLYRQRYGEYPAELRELAEKPEDDPYVKEKDLRTPWGGRYSYAATPKAPAVWTFTPDGKLIGRTVEDE